MKFDWASCAVGVIAGVGTILCVIFAVQLDIFVDTPICAADENGLTCARGWVNAVAVVAAAGTIFFLYRQLREQTKQTAFMVGDADPTFDVFSDELAAVYFRVTNWNRRTLVISEIETEDAENIIVERIRHLPGSEEEFPTGDGLTFRPGLRINAFLDRNSAPRSCVIYARVFGGKHEHSRMFHFRLRGRLLGDEHREIVLTARAEIDTFTNLDWISD